MVTWGLNNTGGDRCKRTLGGLDSVSIRIAYNSNQIRKYLRVRLPVHAFLRNGIRQSSGTYIDRPLSLGSS